MDTLHGTDNQLENYALGRLPESDLVILEEHLMTCAACRQRLDELEDFAVGMREALETYVEPASAPRKDWFAFLRRPVFAIAFSAAALIAVFFGATRERTVFAPVATLQLSAMRGNMPSTTPAREVDLTLTDAPQTGGPFHLELVDSTGKSLWSEIVQPSSRGIEAKIKTDFKPGDYFVRLYSLENRMVHEYGFRIQP